MLALAQVATEGIVASQHRHGPHGLDSWTLNSPMPGDTGEPRPVTLVIAKHGHVLHRIAGDPFVWQWIFVAGGRQVAYEAGPLHFGKTCILLDRRTGRRLAALDCWRDLPVGAPQWVRRLEAPTPP